MIEELIELYKSNLLPSTDKLYRLNTGGDRLYYKFEGEKPIFFQSVTTAIHRNTPTSPHLVKWIAGMGYEEAELYKNERAAFGTFMHKEIESFILNGMYDFDKMDEELKAYLEVNNYNPSLYTKWIEEMKKDIAAFIKWFVDYEVEPLCVEGSFAMDFIAGMIDLVCEMTVEEKGYFGEVYKSGENKGQPKESKRKKRVLAIVDFKSGKNFYDNHAIQLEVYRLIWNHNFPQTPIELIYNWSPKDWQTEPSYNFKDQTNNGAIDKVPMILEMAKLDSKKFNRTMVRIKGVTTGNLSENITFMDYEQMVTSWKS